MRRLLLTILTLLSSSTFLAAATKTKQLPNVIVVLVDDLGWMDLSIQGSDFYKTPNIDRLAKTGTRFTDGYAACAVCSPTRAALMTGRHPHRLGITDWIRAEFQLGGRQGPKSDLGREFMTPLPRDLSLVPPHTWLSVLKK